MTTASLLQVVISLIAGIGLIILLTTKYRVHAFFALLLACSVVGLGVQMSVGYIISVVKDGFGHIMRSLGLIIVLGTTLGTLLEYTRSTRVMSTFILKKCGERHAPLAMSISILNYARLYPDKYSVQRPLFRSSASRLIIDCCQRVSYFMCKSVSKLAGSIF
jgi:hypothetical protein